MPNPGKGQSQKAAELPVCAVNTYVSFASIICVIGTSSGESEVGAEDWHCLVA
jgi:hypothetical protein